MPPAARVAVIGERRQAKGGIPPAPGNIESIHALVREAFEALNRRVKRLNDQQTGKVKRHPEQELRAVVARLFEDHGFLRTIDGRDVYFHRHSLINEDFDRLKEGEGVAFEEEVGDEGWQATSVRVVDHRGHR
jgi:cold shock CspA family protein